MNKAKINLSIHAPDTTIIHRAGILGLWMTLKQLEAEFPQPHDCLGGIWWNLTNDSISIDWQGEDLEVLDWLLKQSFRLDDRGIIQLTGLQRKSIPLENQIHLHQTILATLLQYNGSVQPLKKSYFESVDVQVGNLKLSLSYKPLTSYFYQNFASELCEKKTQQLKQNRYIPIVSRLYPGAIVQHDLIRAKNQCREKLEYAFALLFVPIASQFLVLSEEIKKQISSEKSHPTEYLMIIPETTNLENDN
ncbi:type I-MYXAN CRISPR-associated Cas8a1/Cmx1 [Cyanobacterium sp. Dongsha4]|uniref:type I-MYXAN CRISPR-associated Cas8a1/Cmx1 n=1 Tax=Cyanobacterium sp. DS4 TaxID=2878255 RepID=UPI002E823587|nr:type I-MYXAN CRISPR-associated Cas8a1/Cmx1 [Cyanobacterium sp. Dongsha4]WVL00221.1 type I-MYXAN CRISPR-associated Cas8a1/Cmx1 [Cyanobacterium sp. Dongsha4]